MKWLRLILTIICIFAADVAAAQKRVNPQNNQLKNSAIFPANKELGNQVGKFNLSYSPTTKYQEIKQFLQSQQIFDILIRNLNNSGLVMRSDIPVVFEECGEINAFWSSKDNKISMCYEYVAFNLYIFQKTANLSVEESLKKSINNTIFTFYHELGHALIDVLPLAAVGQEEDTVDEFATIMLLRANNQADEIVLDAANFYLILSNGNEPPAWDEHSLNTKRLFNLVCFVFGSNPEHNSDVFLQTLATIHDKNEKISKEQIERRASLCVQDYQDKVARWNRLLLPHYAGKQGGWGNSRPPSSTPSNSQKKPAPGKYSRPGKVW